jgi:hypothetical protein
LRPLAARPARPRPGGSARPLSGSRPERPARSRKSKVLSIAGKVWREEVTTYYSFEVVSRLMAVLDAWAAAVADALDVEQLDLMPFLKRSLNAYYDAFHATPAGARAIATVIAAAILRQPSAIASMRLEDALIGDGQSQGGARRVS